MLAALLQTLTVDKLLFSWQAYIARYGRRVFVKLETSSTSSQVEAALRAAMQDDFDIEASAEYKSILKNTSMSVIVLGGGVHYASELIQAKQLKEDAAAVSQ